MCELVIFRSQPVNCECADGSGCRRLGELASDPPVEGSMARRAFRPTRENREEAVGLLWKEVTANSQYRRSLTERGQSTFYRDAIRDFNVGLGTIRHTGLQLTYSAIEASWQNLPDKEEQLRRAFCIFYWYAEISRQHRLARQFGDNIHEDFFTELLHQMGIAAACGHTKFVDWMAPYCLKLLLGGGGVTINFMVDAPARLFTGLLLGAISGRCWPQCIDTAALKNYAPLFATPGDPAAFREALIEYSDYRIAQCFRYDGMDATKRRPLSITGSVLDDDTWGRLFPVELFLLKYAFECTGRGTLSLDAGHPLLQTPLMQAPFPPLEPLYEDDFVRQVQKFGFVAFGKWQLMEPLT
jgi:hypothetical protein